MRAISSPGLPDAGDTARRASTSISTLAEMSLVVASNVPVPPRALALEIWSEVVYGEDEAGGVSLVDLNTTNPERMDTPCTRIRESRSDIQR
jgi:hypothetical protein